MGKVKWILDPTHSEIGFKVRHMMITNVKGAIKEFAVDIPGEELFAEGIEARLVVTSIDTNNTQRDEHLRSADFFDTAQFPEMKFVAKTINAGDSAGEYEVQGSLTIKDVTRQASFQVEFGGLSKDPWGNEKAGLSFEGKINRNDWGLTWNAALESGGVLVGEEVRLNGELQFIKQHENI